jgi:hypothetical protein
MGSGQRFHDLMRAGAALNYATRCRLVVDEVVGQYKRLADPSNPSSGAENWAWLEDELAAAAATPGTMAQLLWPASLVETAAADSPDDLRSWVWRGLGSPSDLTWSRGPESRSVWSFLMSPVPADEDELWWLASSNGLGTEQLRGLIDAAARSAPAPGAAGV